MKKTLSSLLALLLTGALVLTGCSGSVSDPGAGDAEESPAADGAESAAEGDSQEGAEASDTTGGKPGEGKRIALVCDPAGTQVFILMMIDGLNKSAETYGFEPIVVECADTAAYEDNIRALVQEGTDLIIGGGWQAADPLNRIAQEFPDAADYALIDSEVEAPNVKCISYREQEGAYLIGMIAAMVVDDDANKFGGVHVNQGPGSWKWRYGFQEGIKSLKPDAEFNYYYTGDFNDPAGAKESAIMLSEWGAQFVNAAAAGGDIGVFEAALEKGFYTSGQDVDLTDPENAYIVSSQIKDTDATVSYLIDNYFSGWTSDNEEWGLAEGTIGAVHVTHESSNPISDRLSEEEVAALKQAADDIRNGTLDLSNMPEETE